jgi:plasmid maintenance system antidote protein VapI
MRVHTAISIKAVHEQSGNVWMRIHTAISIKVVHEQSGKVEYERERLAGNR